MWNDMGAWLTRHEQDADLYSVWCIVAAFALLAIVKLVTWGTIRNQRDRTSAGTALKGQKAAETVMFVCLAGLYGLSLWVFYTGSMPINIWGRTAIRFAVVGGTVTAAVFGMRLILALRELNFGRPDDREKQP